MKCRKILRIHLAYLSFWYGFTWQARSSHSARWESHR